MQITPRWTANTLTTVIALTLLTLSPQADGRVNPLGSEARAILEAIPEDPAPENLVRGSHYVISNEDRPHLFHGALVDRGGVLTGVGTDQLWVYAGWARSEVLIPMDFDRTVIDLHEIYMLLFTKAATPAEFIGLWHKRNEKQLKTWLDEHEPDAARRKGLGYALRVGRQLVFARLKRMHARYGHTKTPTFATDQAQYDHLVDLVKTGRVHPVRGDLTQQGCLQGIGEAVAKLGHTVDVIYLSNAEQYFNFDDVYRENFLTLPIDKTSVVLRTTPKNQGGLYRYETQTTADFQAWLRLPKIISVKQIRYHKKPGRKKDTYRFPGPVEGR